MLHLHPFNTHQQRRFARVGLLATLVVAVLSLGCEPHLKPVCPPTLTEQVRKALHEDPKGLQPLLAQTSRLGKRTTQNHLTQTAYGARMVEASLLMLRGQKTDLEKAHNILDHEELRERPKPSLEAPTPPANSVEKPWKKEEFQHIKQRVTVLKEVASALRDGQVRPSARPGKTVAADVLELLRLVDAIYAPCEESGQDRYQNWCTGVRTVAATTWKPVPNLEGAQQLDAEPERIVARALDDLVDAIPEPPLTPDTSFTCKDYSVPPAFLLAIDQLKTEREKQEDTRNREAALQRDWNELQQCFEAWLADPYDLNKAKGLAQALAGRGLADKHPVEYEFMNSLYEIHRVDYHYLQRGGTGVTLSDFDQHAAIQLGEYATNGSKANAVGAYWGKPIVQYLRAVRPRYARMERGQPGRLTDAGKKELEVVTRLHSGPSVEAVRMAARFHLLDERVRHDRGGSAEEWYQTWEDGARFVQDAASGTQPFSPDGLKTFYETAVRNRIIKRIAACAKGEADKSNVSGALSAINAAEHPRLKTEHDLPAETLLAVTEKLYTHPRFIKHEVLADVLARISKSHDPGHTVRHTWVARNIALRRAVLGMGFPREKDPPDWTGLKALLSHKGTPTKEEKDEEDWVCYLYGRHLTQERNASDEAQAFLQTHKDRLVRFRDGIKQNSLTIEMQLKPDRLQTVRDDGFWGSVALAYLESARAADNWAEAKEESMEAERLLQSCESSNRPWQQVAGYYGELARKWSSETAAADFFQKKRWAAFRKTKADNVVDLQTQMIEAYKALDWAACVKAAREIYEHARSLVTTQKILGATAAFWEAWEEEDRTASNRLENAAAAWAQQKPWWALEGLAPREPAQTARLALLHAMVHIGAGRWQDAEGAIAPVRAPAKSTNLDEALLPYEAGFLTRLRGFLMVRSAGSDTRKTAQAVPFLFPSGQETDPEPWYLPEAAAALHAAGRYAAAAKAYEAINDGSTPSLNTYRLWLESAVEAHDPGKDPAKRAALTRQLNEQWPPLSGVEASAAVRFKAARLLWEPSEAQADQGAATEYVTLLRRMAHLEDKEPIFAFLPGFNEGKAPPQVYVLYAVHNPTGDHKSPRPGGVWPEPLILWAREHQAAEDLAAFQKRVATWMDGTAQPPNSQRDRQAEAYMTWLLGRLRDRANRQKPLQLSQAERNALDLVLRTYAVGCPEYSLAVRLAEQAAAAP